MSEEYPTPAETQEYLDEIWASDPELYHFMHATSLDEAEACTQAHPGAGTKNISHERELHR